ncbi:alpha/beta fold hydrolase [Ideonella azotifigens]|uniref:AB hydrolase-1 domain-containing protein n=1 Tax=Ideonella azotifigens TaxID=513160 RepID=A0ABN1KDJ1_9BURK|nr:alpha/beta fold hydrolase [Ideonella azotifigens]MCD2344489.1 alpha/beta fold hydrolase [Ideonella azotifigens]
MVARWQRFLTLLGFALVLGGAGCLLAQGHAGWALALLALGLCGHAAWLGLTCALAAWQNRRDAASTVPTASAAQWLAAWWAEVCTAPQVFCWRQPFRSQAEPDVLPGDAQGRIGVVLVHGFLCNRGFWNPWIRRLRALGVPCIAVSLEPVFGSIDDYVPTLETAVRQLSQLTGRPPLLVGHSMGGLAIRAWLRANQAGGGSDARVHGVVTMGSPHHGTWLAGFSRRTNGEQMRQHSAWLSTLAASESASRQALFVCLFSHCDNIVFPARSAVLPGASAVLHVAGAAHVDLMQRPESFAAVCHALGLAPADTGAVLAVG